MNIICDIDGTLADATHRLHYIQNKPKDWTSFFAQVRNDAPHDDIRWIVDQLYFNPDSGENSVNLHLVSGRPERTREDTVTWLRDMLVWHPWVENAGYRLTRVYYRLHMRKDGDRRADDIVKEEILDTALTPAGVTPTNTLAVFDDRDRVVAMWRRRGFRVLQVAPGDF